MTTERKIELDGTYMNVIQFGNGKKNLVILSGVSLCGLEGQGEAVAAAYAMFQEEYTVYLFDRKKVLPAGYQVRDMAQDVYRTLQILGVEEADVYGVSQGGMMALCLAIDHPELVHGLVVCSSQARVTDKMKENAQIWIRLADKKDVIALNRYFFEIVYSEEFLESVAELLPTLEKQGTPEDCERFKILAEACRDFDVIDELEKVKCFTMVIGDENDNTIGVEGTKELAEKLDCPFYIYGQYSHAVFDEAPDIKDRILDFFHKL